MPGGSTQFIPYTLEEDGHDENDVSYLKPILASFPQKIPANLNEMNFRLLENPDSKEKPESKKKRVIKANGKNVKYTASSFGMNVADRNQCLDYYVGVISNKDDVSKVYTMQVACPYQFQQEIKGFQEKYGSTDDNEAIKNMTYMEKKALLVQLYLFSSNLDLCSVELYLLLLFQ